jgi:hypothetical protein
LVSIDQPTRFSLRAHAPLPRARNSTAWYPPVAAASAIGSGAVLQVRCCPLLHACHRACQGRHACALDGCIRVRVEIMGSQKCRMMIHPVILTLTRRWLHICQLAPGCLSVCLCVCV